MVLVFLFTGCETNRFKRSGKDHSFLPNLIFATIIRRQIWSTKPGSLSLMFTSETLMCVPGISCVLKLVKMQNNRVKITHPCPITSCTRDVLKAQAPGASLKLTILSSMTVLYTAWQMETWLSYCLHFLLWVIYSFLIWSLDFKHYCAHSYNPRESSC